MKYILFVLVTSIVFTAAAAGSEGWAGLYRKTGGSVIGIGELHEFGKAEVLVDYSTGEAGPLFQVSEGRMGVGRAIGDQSPPPIHQLERSGGQIRLDGKVLTEIPIARQPFQVKNGPIKIAGELVRTKEKAKGVVVVVHGSGDGPRRAYDIWTNFFLSRGWAVVVYDKRGSDSSTGDWHDANLTTLAGDLDSVITWTRTRPELKGLKLGVWGVSQAGWIIPQIAAEGSADFIIVQAGPATPVDEFLGKTLESELRAYGFSSEEIGKAQAYYALDVAVSRGEKPYAMIEAAYREAMSAGAEWILKAPDPEGAPDRRFMAAIAGFDPARYWQKVRVPLLALFGGKDHVVPAEENRGRLETFLAEAGNKQAEIVTLENDNHLNMLAKTGVRTEYATLSRFDPVYFATMTRFLERMALLHR